MFFTSIPKKLYLTLISSLLILIGSFFFLWSKTDKPFILNAFVFTSAGDYGGTLDTSRVLHSIGSENPAFHLALGDLSMNDIKPENAWCDFVSKNVGLKTSFQLLAGNHESDGDRGSIENFASCLPNKMENITGVYSKEYYFDYPAKNPLARIILISPNLHFNDGETFSYDKNSTHYNWTEKAIEDAHAKNIPWVVVGMHKMCLSVGVKTCEVGKDLADMLIDKKVDLVLTGHDHAYERTKSLSCIEPEKFRPECVADQSENNIYQKGAGTVFVTSGTGGVPLRDIDKKDKEFDYFASLMGQNMKPTKGYAKITINANRLSVRFVGVTGDLFSDFFVIREKSIQTLQKEHE